MVEIRNILIAPLTVAGIVVLATTAVGVVAWLACEIEYKSLPR